MIAVKRGWCGDGGVGLGIEDNLSRSHYLVGLSERPRSVASRPVDASRGRAK